VGQFESTGLDLWYDSAIKLPIKDGHTDQVNVLIYASGCKADKKARPELRFLQPTRRKKFEQEAVLHEWHEKGNQKCLMRC